MFITLQRSWEEIKLYISSIRALYYGNIRQASFYFACLVSSFRGLPCRFAGTIPAPGPGAPTRRIFMVSQVTAKKL